MSANNRLNSKIPANNNAPQQQKLIPREQLLQGVLETYPSLTHEEADQIIKDYRF